MIAYKIGNLMNAANDGVKLIAHGCNAQGVMGSGVALAVKKQFPEAFEIYDEAFHNGQLHMGSNIIAKGNFAIANMITQDEFGTHKRQVSYDAIADGFVDLFQYATENNITEIGIPLIGAGLGGGDWRIIEAIILAVMDRFDINVTVYVLTATDIPVWRA